jgi:hypothetical protein
MRKHLRPYWTPIESGGVFLMTGVDETAYTEFLMGFGQLPEAVAAASDNQRLTIVVEILSHDAWRFFLHAELAPGPYKLDNYHLDYADDGELQFSADDEPPIKLPAERNFTFELTAEHLKLIRRLNTRDWYGYIEAMNPKRPYGEMTFYAIDMAEALDEDPLPRNDDGYIQLTEAQEERYTELHREMLFAIQAFWQYAEVK